MSTHKVTIQTGSGFSARHAALAFDSYQAALQAVLDHAVSEDGTLHLHKDAGAAVHSWTLVPGPASDSGTTRRQVIALKEGGLV